MIEIYISYMVLAVVILILFYLLLINIRKTKELKIEIANRTAIQRGFFEADDRGVYLKDENFKYVFVNHSFLSFYEKQASEIIGYQDSDIADSQLAKRRRETDIEVIEKGALVIDEVEWSDKVFEMRKFPVVVPSGRYGVGAYITDITAERRYKVNKDNEIKRHKIIANAFTRNFQSSQEQCDFVIHQAQLLTASQYGYLHSYHEDKPELEVNTWTHQVREDCKVEKEFNACHLQYAGFWGEMIRNKRPIIINELTQDYSHLQGFPNGHVKLTRLMAVPVLIDDKIVAIIGLANKETDYTDEDVYETTMLIAGIWNVIDRKRIQEKLSIERKKYLKTLLSIGDGVIVVDQNKNLEMINQAAEKLTGWTYSEAKGKYYKDILLLLENPDVPGRSDPIEMAFSENNIEQEERISVLQSKIGKKYFIENVASPIKDKTNNTIGVVLIFRDISQKIEQREKIEHLSFHDHLTGLHNRMYFEEEVRRLDVEENLPISVIMGDVNGLKLTNDIFGHNDGDALLKRAAEILKSVCRDQDIVARLGGDEFVILLPKTKLDDAEKVVYRTKNRFSKERVGAVNCSMALGCATKTSVDQDMEKTMGNAENKMYKEKTLARRTTSAEAVNTIIATLYARSPREEQHSLNVGELCETMGIGMNMQKADIEKLKKIGYLHDIGKIVLNNKLLNEDFEPTADEWIEIKKHPLVGYRILNLIDDTMNYAEIILAHHEHWDGSGYPKGLKGEETPLLARVLSIIEGFERRLNGNYNLKPVGIEKALNFIRLKSGSFYDPTLSDLFIKMVEKEYGKSTD